MHQPWEHQAFWEGNVLRRSYHLWWCSWSRLHILSFVFNNSFFLFSFLRNLYSITLSTKRNGSLTCTKRSAASVQYNVPKPLERSIAWIQKKMVVVLCSRYSLNYQFLLFFYPGYSLNYRFLLKVSTTSCSYIWDRRQRLHVPGQQVWNPWTMRQSRKMATAAEPVFAPISCFICWSHKRVIIANVTTHVNLT